ncbi:hypothetical protein SAMN04488526_0110 [Jannaschia helgolandensis]|jgi:hypothetical protein|uniref:Uncharacterized protein n=1 Tax=Jannaschia helgolandensis TaxID=188906 RepID=A0A1H7FJ91_9RHOB|nr:hypothetical protein SAMN04488526_0110 [Jannaschia helgolandensis]
MLAATNPKKAAGRNRDMRFKADIFRKALLPGAGLERTGGLSDQSRLSLERPMIGAHPG